MRFTVRDFVNAAEKNGLTHERGSWFGVDAKGKISGCIMGQAAYNLIGTTDENEADFLFTLVNTSTDFALKDIINLNDTPKLSGKYRSYSDLVRALKTRTKKYLDVVIDYTPEKEEEPDW